jgi:23S rRNA-intervening sequence protein
VPLIATATKKERACHQPEADGARGLANAETGWGGGAEVDGPLAFAGGVPVGREFYPGCSRRHETHGIRALHVFRRQRSEIRKTDESRKQRSEWVRGFEELEVFRRAYRVSLEVRRASLDFPRIEQFALAGQVRQASKSICANLAEGFGRQPVSKPEFRRFVMMATGSTDDAGLAALLPGSWLPQE